MGRTLDKTASGVLGVATAPVTLCIIAVALRFYTRHIQQAGYGIDDWLTLPALVLTIGMSISMIIGVEDHVLGHPTPLPPNPADTLAFTSYNTVITGELQFANILMQFVQIGLVKASVIFFYRRIFCTHKKFTTFSVISYIMLFIVITWSIAFLFASIFQCGLTFDAAWSNGERYARYCPGVEKKNIAISSSDFAIDVLIISMPIPVIWRLHLDTTRKIAVSGVFLLGLVAVAASLARLITNVQAVASISSSVDPVLLITSTMYWGLFESGMALFACCLSTLHFLFGRMSANKLMQSIRSILSLDSLRSQSSRNRRGERLEDDETHTVGPQTMAAGHTKAETALGLDATQTQTKAFRDEHGANRDSFMELGQIRVQQSYAVDERGIDHGEAV
ncbi:MAG: hypothetical protein M1821_005562 [Bathelium mastoideum]|nr:MAG: hypothetical protein M1821_005562 [Bathelium mastoideum]